MVTVGLNVLSCVLIKWAVVTVEIGPTYPDKSFVLQKTRWDKLKPHTKRLKRVILVTPFLGNRCIEKDLHWSVVCLQNTTGKNHNLHKFMRWWTPIFNIADISAYQNVMIMKFIQFPNLSFLLIILSCVLCSNQPVVKWYYPLLEWFLFPTQNI